jgi:hypothetical protein
MTGHSRIDELRAKTERDLVQLINRELDLGMQEATQALSADTWAFAAGHYVTAQRAYEEASRLLRMVEEPLPDQPEVRVEQLREMLDGLRSGRRSPERAEPRSQRALHTVCC